MPFKTPLEAAIAHLISKGVVKSNADVARDLQLKSRGNVNDYATGQKKISSSFQTKFEEHYKISLSDFDENGLKSKVPPPPDKIDTVLFAVTQILTEVQNGNHKLNGLEQMQIVNAAMQNQYFEWLVSHLDQKADAADTVKSLQRKAFEKLTGNAPADKKETAHNLHR